MSRVADVIMSELAEFGCKTVFQVTGRGSLYLSDALAKEGRLQSVSMHHEQSCGYAAVADALVSDRPGVCLVSTGCGATNTVSAVLTAWQDEVPVLFLSGQHYLRQTTRYTTSRIRTFGQQETDIVSIVKPITKLAHMLTDAREAKGLLAAAVRTATSGRPGPVWIDIPLDLQSASFVESSSSADANQFANSAAAKNELQKSLAQLLDWLNQSTRPIFLIGRGMQTSRARAALARLVSRSGLPVVYSSSAVDVLGSGQYPESIGSVGAMGCSRAGAFALQNADLVVALGTRLLPHTIGPDFTQFARAARVVVIDVDDSYISRDGVSVTRFIPSTPEAVVETLAALPDTALPDLRTSSWRAKCLAWKALSFSSSNSKASQEGIDLHELASSLSRVLPSPAVLVTDSGFPEVILPTNIAFRDGVKAVHPVSQGAMGFALPAAIGAFFSTHAPIVVVTGDGSIMMNLQELETIRYHGIPIKLIVIANGMYGIIRRRQAELFRKRQIGTDKTNGVGEPNFATIAAAFDLKFSTVDEAGSLDEQLQDILSDPYPHLVLVPGNPDQEYVEMRLAREEGSRRMRLRPLEDQYPFLSRDEFRSNMVIDSIS